MATRTFYLAYRSQKIEELDLRSVREQLTRILSSRRIPHAFLFAGPKGLGKTSAARIVAKAVNCETIRHSSRATRQYEPCNKCTICTSITAGICLDLIEIDAASNRGIDDIRDLKEKIKLSPTIASKKVYVIDEAHMLTLEAFNALLKTLEEPPSHVLFILCTTAPQKLPETIVSRCIRIDFPKATLQEIIRSLQRIVKGEKLKLEDGVLEKIAKSSGGSFRDAAKILEQASLGVKKITLDDLSSLVDQSAQFDLLNLIDLLLQKDSKAALLWLGKAMEKGIDLQWLIEEILKQLRVLLLASEGINPNYQLPITNYQFQKTDLIDLIKLFDRAGVEARYAMIPSLPIELAIIQVCSRKSHLAADATALQAGKSKVKSSKSLKSQNSPTQKISNSLTTNIDQKWTQVLAQIKPLNHSVEALLRSSRPIGIKDGFFNIEVFYEFHKGRLKEEKNRQIIERALQKVFACSLKVRYTLGKRKKKPTIQSQEEDLAKTAAEIFGG